MFEILLVYILMQKSYGKDLLSHSESKSEANLPLTSKDGVAEIFAL